MLLRNNFRFRSRIICEWTIMPVDRTIDRVCFPVVTLSVVTMIIEEIPIPWAGYTIIYSLVLLSK